MLLYLVYILIFLLIFYGLNYLSFEDITSNILEYQDYDKYNIPESKVDKGMTDINLIKHPTTLSNYNKYTSINKFITSNQSLEKQYLSKYPITQNYFNARKHKIYKFNREVSIIKHVSNINKPNYISNILYYLVNSHYKPS